MTLPGVSQLLADIKILEDFARACRSHEDVRMVMVTREEAEVIDSYRRFRSEEV
ncbi:MAG TPA: hypothetical protein VGF49_01245 [Candidatus Solibacter sp.]|jgi:hypothetical protein